MEVYREILPESYLLILTDDSQPTARAQLSYALRRAIRSGKPSIWIDCSHLRNLSFSTLRLLVRYYQRLRERQIPLVLCHLGDSAHQLLARLPTSSCPPVVPSLLDAERYCRSQHVLVH
ncbi:STAS domain-containing protein [Hymenobacter sp. 5516J-16]|uniref:STAS domain-containing protein n=1 Tax=Hymenobacter sublimis TaxID=2933777 RepID=A0ABY4J791_9BACT|nr:MULTISPECIES: STAS domain-containing protein [Hymenobacter]UOQ78727.1 STAS domain-containing protein [Hymenobacter sp. 5516J-16]UPL48697.1 STAS domain-containing protein [Hymenobacter sublimis]